MSEGEPTPPQQLSGNQTEAEKAAEEERRAAQEILEGLYDPFTENDWLVHTIKDENKLGEILNQGILTKKFADRAKSINIKNINLNYHRMQGRDNISTFKKEFTIHTPISTWIKIFQEGDIAIMFTPLKRNGEEGFMVGEINARLRVAPRRFKFLVIRDPDIFEGCKTKLQIIMPMASQYRLPVIDSRWNIRYPIQIPAKNLQEITVPRLRELAKTLGIEKLRAMSVEEIKSAADALKEET